MHKSNTVCDFDTIRAVAAASIVQLDTLYFLLLVLFTIQLPTHETACALKVEDFPCHVYELGANMRIDDGLRQKLTFLELLCSVRNFASDVYEQISYQLLVPF